MPDFIISKDNALKTNNISFLKKQESSKEAEASSPNRKFIHSLPAEIIESHNEEMYSNDKIYEFDKDKLQKIDQTKVVIANNQVKNSINIVFMPERYQTKNVKDK